MNIKNRPHLFILPSNINTLVNFKFLRRIPTKRIIKGRFLSMFLVMFFIMFIYSHNSIAQIETIPTGSFIVNMGVTPQTVGNALKPYGMIYDLITNYGVPIKWIVDNTKGKDGIDFTYDGVNYRGGPFIIKAEYRTTAVDARITHWTTNEGVIGVTTTSPFDVNVAKTLTVSTAPNWTLDYQNGKLALPYFDNAGIPPSAYGGVSQSGWKLPSQLNNCDDIFVMPHADPRWATHSHLMDWNLNSKGSIWTGCHAASALENMYNPANPSQQTNFLTEKVTVPGTGIILPIFGSTNYSQNSLVLWTNHDDGTPPYSYGANQEPVMQFMGIIDGAVLNGSEQIYLPVNGTGSGWRSTTVVGVWDPDQPDLTNFNDDHKAALIAYGRGYGDPNRGYVMMEASHKFSKSTAPPNIAAQRAFFNFSFLSGKVKSPDPGITTSFPTVASGGSVELSFIVTPPRQISEFTVAWSSACGGSFAPTVPADPSKILFTAPIVSSNINCNVTLTLTDGCGHVYKSTSIVLVTCDLQVTTTLNPACYGLSNGSIEMSITGGSPIFNWSWTDSGSGSGSGSGTTISGLAASTYAVTVTSSGGSGCSKTFTVTINENPQIVVTATPVNVLCNGGSTGSINVAVSGGTPGYTYSWADGPTTQNRNTLAAGTYTVTVTDSKGCTNIASPQVTEPSIMTITPSITNVTCNGLSNGIINLDVSPTATYSFLWNDGSSSQNRTALAPGTYSVTVTNSNGCTKTASGLSVTQPTAISASAGASTILCNGGTSTITVTASGGTGTLQYSLNGGTFQTSNQFTGISASASAYNITVKDDNDCTFTTNVLVSEPSAIVLSTVITHETCIGDSDGAINLSVSGGTPSYTYAWTASGGGAVPGGQEDDEDLTALVAGTYTVVVTDNNSCTATTSATVIVTNPEPVTPGSINH